MEQDTGDIRTAGSQSRQCLLVRVSSWSGLDVRFTNMAADY